jgi:hypothetical protein
MKGINGQPYVDCEPFLDIKGLQDIELEIATGIALSKMKSGIYGPGIVNSEKYGNYLSMKQEIEQNPELIEKYRWNEMTQEQKRLFLKLYKKLYSPNNSVYLREATNVNSLKTYLEKWNPELYPWNDNITHFPKLIKWLDSLTGTVFEKYGRVIFFIHEHDCELLVHRDGTAYRPHNNEFIWINPLGAKSFFVYDEDTGDKHHVPCRAAFFNDLDMHGGDPKPHMTWTLRVDGIFTEEFKKKLKIDQLSHY